MRQNAPCARRTGRVSLTSVASTGIVLASAVIWIEAVYRLGSDAPGHWLHRMKKIKKWIKKGGRRVYIE
jgi:hypothetical protein